MPVSYMVNGSALVYAGVGSAGSLALLGYTESGVQKRITENKAEIITDLFGPMTPQDFQDMGMVARIVCPFIATDRDVLALVMNRGDRAAIGSINTPGLILGVTGYAFPLFIASNFDSPWYFYKTIVRGEDTTLATRANPYTLEFFAWPYLPPTYTSGKNAPLWRRSMT